MNRFQTLVFIFSILLNACSALPTSPQLQPLPSGSVLFQDDFAQATTGWDRMLVPEGVMDYDSGGSNF